MILNARMLMAPPKKQKAFVHRDERPSRGTTRLHRPLARPASSSPQRERLKTPARSRGPSGSAYCGSLRFDLRLRGLFRRCPGPSFSAARGSLSSQRPRTRPHRRLYVCTCWRERYPPSASMSSHRTGRDELLDIENAVLVGAERFLVLEHRLRGVAVVDLRQQPAPGTNHRLQHHRVSHFLDCVEGSLAGEGDDRLWDGKAGTR